MTIPTNPGFVVGRFHSSFNPNSENPLFLLQPHVQRPEKKKIWRPSDPSRGYLEPTAARALKNLGSLQTSLPPIYHLVCPHTTILTAYTFS